MFWVVALIILGIICACLGDEMGKVALAIVVIAAALLLISWITGIEFFTTLAIIGAVILIIIIVIAVVVGIFGS